MQDSFLGNFYLVGGTALALHFGHRISEDIDLFSDSAYQLLELKNHIQNKYEADVYGESTIGLRCYIQEVKTDFLNYPYPVMTKPKYVDGLRILTVPDIAAMKIAAINNRGAKRDFYDLYFLLDNFKMQELVGFFSKKYKVQNLFSIYRSLTYYEDAEADADPVLLLNKSLTWEMVKERLDNIVGEIFT
jgi:predicted nucleotidyltransferase component of viral defense system